MNFLEVKEKFIKNLSFQKGFLMAETIATEFGTFRSMIWPIYRHECRKLIPMLLMLFLICFNYSALRNMKDVLVITTAGAEVIPFIKVWAILPMAIFVTFIFTKLSNKYSQERVFYFMVSGFLLFYAVFAFVLYPLRETLHCHNAADALQTMLPEGFKGFISMFRYWSFTVFYVMSELWSTSIMTVLFWGFVNEVTRLKEAKRFYSVLSIGSNFAAITSGMSAVKVSQHGYFNPNIPLGRDSWEQSMMILVLLIICSGLLTMVVFRWMNQKVLTDSEYDDLHEAKRLSQQKERLSFRDSLSYVANSNYLICIAVIVVSYNLVINLVEVVWKDQLKNLYPLPSDYSDYINNLLIVQGIVSTILALAMSKLIDGFGWTRTALITPIVMLFTCLGFFGFLFFQDRMMDFGSIAISFLGMSPFAIAVFFGSSQNALSKATKYSVFDATKEMAYIPLSHESKLKGKAAIDGVGSRFGKSGGSLIHQSLLMIFVTVQASAPYVATILVGVIVFWVIAVRSLGLQFAGINQQVDKPFQETPTLA